MTFLTLPTSPGFTTSSFGLTSNTQLFRSPLSGQTQTIEHPGARWKANYTLPPMKRAQAALWQSFLLQLRGGAGRFYGYDADAKQPRGSALQVVTASRNEIRNSELLGAQLGVIGSGGLLPTNWGLSTVSGITREITGLGSENGINYIQLRFSGTPTSTYQTLSFDGTQQIAAAEGQDWAASFAYKLAGGSLTNIAAVQIILAALQSNGSSALNSYGTLPVVDGTWRQGSYARTLLDTTPDTAFVRPGLYLKLTAGMPIDITLRLGQMQLERGSSASSYIPTFGTPRTRGTGACVDGAGQSGSSLKTWNWQPSQNGVLKTGDYVAYDTPQGRTLHLVTSDVNSDATGRATLPLEPPLRASPNDNAPLILQNASCLMALDDSSVVWQTNAQGIYTLSFAAEERF